MSPPSPLTRDVKEYFRNPNVVVRGLDPQAPSVFHECLELIIPALRGKKVLDVGAGKGRLSVLLAERGSEVTAVDISPEALAELEKYAKSRGVGVRAILGDAESLEAADKSMDAVFCIETLVHVPNISKALSEFIRVLKDGGILVCSVTMPLSFSAWLKLTGRERLIGPVYSSRMYQNYFRKVLGRPRRTGREIREEEIVRALNSSGFTLLYKFVVLSRFLFVVGQKTGSEGGVAWVDGCPFLRLFPNAESMLCMAPKCGKTLPASHGHSKSTGECLCSQHLRSA